MSLKDSLSENEFKKLVEKLSDRKNELEGRITINSVRESLAELGLSDLLRENDIEEVCKQVSKEFKRQQRSNYLSFALILIILVAPLAAFGGYKLKEYLTSKLPSVASEVPDESVNLSDLNRQINELKTNQTQLEAQLKDSQAEKDKLNQKIEQLDAENEALKSRPVTDSPIVTTPRSSSSETTSSSTQTFEAQGIVYELRKCEKSNVSSDSQSVVCTLLITSTQENIKLFLYTKRSGNISRMFEAGKEYQATKAKLGLSTSSSRVSNSLIKNIQIEASITFDIIPQEVKRMEVLQISSYLESSYYNGYINIEFRDILLSE